MLNKKIFDCNIHSPNTSAWDLPSLEILNNSLEPHIYGNLMYFPEHNQVNLKEFSTQVNNLARFGIVKCIDPITEDPHRSIGEGIDAGVIAFKLHPRIHKFNLDHPNITSICNLLLESQAPLYICAFDDGTWSRLGLQASQFAHLADNFPDLNFIWGHAGGFRVTEFMFNARRRENVFLDLSFTINYFKFGSILCDVAYAIMSMDGKNWIFGSDSPTFNISQAEQATKKIMDMISQHTDVDQIEKLVMFQNAKKLFPSHVAFNQ